MNKLRKRFKKETGEDYLIEVNKSESNTEFNWQYVKWLEEQIVSKNESLHLVSSSLEMPMREEYYDEVRKVWATRFKKDNES